jgi:nitrogen fixation protein NifU and related proteins
MSDDLYKEEILDHYWNPHNAGTLAHATANAEEYNVTCGDKIHLYLMIDDDKVVDVRFQGEGCAISQASTSMLTDTLKGLGLRQAQAINDHDILRMLGITISPARMKCATLGLETMKRALEQIPNS